MIHDLEGICLAKKKKRHLSGARKKKKSPSSKAFVFVLLVAVVVVIILLVSRSGELRLMKQTQTAAIVNGEEITTAYLEERYSQVPPELRGYITKSALLNQTIIPETLLLQEAEKKGVVVTEDEIDQEISIALETAGITEDELVQRLGEQNVTMEYFKEFYKRQLTMNNLLEQEVFSKLVVTDDEIEEFYDSIVRVIHILVDTEEEALEIIEDMKKVSLNDIEEKFSETAKEKSKDPAAATNGGYYEFGKGQMVPEFEKAAFALEEYAFTAKPVQSQFGYHIILRLPRSQTLDEQYAFIKDALLTQKKNTVGPVYLEQLRSNADIEIFFEEEEPAPNPQEIVTVAPVEPVEPVVAEEEAPQ